VTTAARWIATPDYHAGQPEEAIVLLSQFVRDAWGTEAIAELGAPDLAREDPAYRKWWTKSSRLYMSPKEASKVLEFQLSLDVRDALTLVRVPTLVLHPEGYEAIPVDHGRYLAEHIAGARLAVLPGNDSAFFFGGPAFELGRHHIEEFLSGLSARAEPDRALAALLFTDIVESTARVSALGDKGWRSLLETHDAVARTVVEQHRGRLVKTTGDGMLATFDGPGRAIRCATALRDALGPLGIQVRAGLHTGEVEVMGTDITGIGVHIAARVLEHAEPGDLMVSAAIPMLVAGSGIDFEDRGEHELKGIPGTWRLFVVEG
jgi:class 3 adenylate cyclase